MFKYLNGTNTSLLSFNDDPHIFENTFVRAGLVLVYSVIFFICFFGNLAVILAVALQWKRRSVSKFCLANMAVANFSVSVFCILQNLTLFLLDTWIFGEVMCKMYHLIINLCHAASIFMVVLISIERYVVLVHSLKSRQILTTRKLVLIILAVWILSAVISLPRFFYFGLIRIQLKKDGDFGHVCVPIQSIYNSATVDTIYFVITYLIPLIIMSALYLRIGLFLRQKERLRSSLDEESASVQDVLPTSQFLQTSQKQPDVLNVAVNPEAQRMLYRYKRLQLSRSRCKQRQKVVRMLIFIVVTFALLNLPHHLRKLCLHFLPSFDLASDANNLIASLTFALMYANCAVNPILYAFMSKNFRASLRDFCFGSRRNIVTV